MIFGGAEHHTWAHLRDEGQFSPDEAADAITNMIYQGLQRAAHGKPAPADVSARLERAVQRLEGLTGARRRKRRSA
jgi:TetR/AcrR family fatty acid metabolism transcriptional regulator